ncbi:hypothetical protein QVD17_24717 [Tagetes erecta]|uniref:Uncharacterized protein n=1 Tax=Tagetes erecta TaxID=13708 RepID=A0AAD8KI38_TARER|nr:hypothetical protein QVD17_24717 [Tagetes erecta]
MVGRQPCRAWSHRSPSAGIRHHVIDSPLHHFYNIISISKSSRSFYTNHSPQIILTLSLSIIILNPHHGSMKSSYGSTNFVVLNNVVILPLAFVLTCNEELTTEKVAVKNFCHIPTDCGTLGADETE